jgi:two-component system response regulator AtoC
VFLDFFLRKYSEYYSKKPAPFSENAVNRMMEYEWPGNIRELENLVKRYTIVGNEGQIIRELATHKPIVSSSGTGSAVAAAGSEMTPTNGSVKTTPSGKIIPMSRGKRRA